MLASPMRTDSLQQFVKLHRDLVEEKSSIESRLRQINEALGEIRGVDATPAPAQTQPIRTGRGRPPAAGGQSLKAHVMEVLQDGPKTKEEILQAVQDRGYKFSTKNPANSLGVILYGKNPKFKRVDGKFSLGSGGSSSAGSTKTGRSGKRTMSPEARERIAAAQRARWAKAGAGKTKSSTSDNGAATASKGSSGKRKMSAAGRKRIAEAARARWAAAKAAGKTSL